MDLYCPRCAEPWDLDCLHDEAARRNPTTASGAAYEQLFQEVRDDFYRRGCAALDAPACTDRSTRAAVAGQVYALMGDDVDGAASMLEDAERLGMI